MPYPLYVVTGSWRFTSRGSRQFIRVYAILGDSLVPLYGLNGPELAGGFLGYVTVHPVGVTGDGHPEVLIGETGVLSSFKIYDVISGQGAHFGTLAVLSPFAATASRSCRPHKDRKSVV